MRYEYPRFTVQTLSCGYWVNHTHTCSAPFVKQTVEDLGGEGPTVRVVAEAVVSVEDALRLWGAGRAGNVDS
jgi:hypothetical protein